MPRSCTWIALASGAAVSFALQLHEPLHGDAKGSDLALELVRVGPDGQMRTPDRFLPEDRFKVLVTCPPAWRGYADVLAFQAGETTAPLVPQRIDRCGNRRTLQGAFQLTGVEPITVCVVFSSTAALDRRALRQPPDPLPENWACENLQPTAASARD